ncbi:uncharacterized protein CCOS01_11716 [Colletotrichum costaricense]|uniref:Uncharacterized protein n=1 Tax=Colletotrichum costaricense TaxID=1209916 RepID=A0AAJ0DXF8_9PEZI|nr:uncharacterized protein CCOS01_11716 [Colletotrichum costaricense]KAK1518896.1 hypothetical protein CCOS01_11716 [Colletotrichum costaricense]
MIEIQAIHLPNGGPHKVGFRVTGCLIVYTSKTLRKKPYAISSTSVQPSLLRRAVVNGITGTQGSRRGMQSENRRTSVDLRDLPVTRSLLLISLGSIIERCRRSRLAGLFNSDHPVTVDQKQNILGLEAETEHQRYKRP